MSTFTQFIGSRLQSQTFNSSGTYTAPAGINNVWISLSGGGAGSNYQPNGEPSTGGGAGAWCSKVPVAVTPGSNYTVTVGGAGGTSSFGNLISRIGGSGGGSIGNNVPTYGGGGGANAGAYNITYVGTPAMSAGGSAGGLGGGGGFFGNGANSGSGGGYAGGYNPSSGFSGKVIVEWLG